MKKLIKKSVRSRPKLTFGSRFASFLFIAISMIVAAGILFGANMYFNIDTGEIVMEQVQRVTQTIRATAGLIVGGTPGQNPAAPHRLEIVGGTLFSGTAMVGNVGGTAQDLRFLEGGAGAAQFVGFRAPDGLTTDRAYILPHHDTHAPADNMVLTWTTGNNLRWQTAGGIGAGGDITAVGSMLTGDAFAGPAAHNQWLGLGATAGRLAFVDGVTDFVNILDANVGIGTATPAQRLSVAGTFGILEGGLSPTFFTVFQGGDQVANITYTLPINAGGLNQILTTNGAGVLSWQSVAGVGGLTGAGTVNRLARWTGANTIGDGSIVDNLTTGTALTIAATTGDITIANNLTVSGAGVHAFGGTLDPHHVAGFTLTGPIIGSGTPNITGIGQFSGATAVLSGSVTAPLFTGIGQVIVGSGGTGELILDSATGVIRLAAADHIRTSGDHPIRASGEQILREVIPIFGFDLPARTASTTFVPISRILEDYPFPPAMAGTTRIHKFIIRYADTLNPADAVAANRVSNWRVLNVTPAVPVVVSTFNVSATPGLDEAGLARGEVEITANIPIPTGTDDWRLEVQLPVAGRIIQVYQIFLAAYDQVN